jgi:hypothetical protein
MARKLSYDGQGLRPARIDRTTGEAYAMLFLYNDGCIPTASPTAMQAYLGRLALLAKVRVREESSYIDLHMAQALVEACA